MLKNKIFLIETGREMKKRIDKERSAKKWCAWFGASFAKWQGFYRSAKRHPELYTEDAAKSFAKGAMCDFTELCKVNKDAGRMVFESWRPEIYEMVEEIGEDMKDYYKMMN